jgi:hypothetical protein
VARDAVPTERWSAYIFATFEALEVEDFAGYRWTTLDGEEAPLLPDELWPEVPRAGEAS